MMATKRPSDEDPNLGLNKIQRIEHASPHLPNNDFSGSVKKKLADSKRTGQACDRCKVCTMRQCAPPEIGFKDCEGSLSTAQSSRRAFFLPVFEEAHCDVMAQMRQARREEEAPLAPTLLPSELWSKQANTPCRYARSAAMDDLKAAPHVSKTEHPAAPPTESPDAPQYEATPKPWSQRTHTYALR
jgi:hypothetical protein